MADFSILITRGGEAVDIIIEGANLTYTVSGSSPVSITSGVPITVPAGSENVLVEGDSVEAVTFPNGGLSYSIDAISSTLTDFQGTWAANTDILEAYFNASLANITSLVSTFNGATELTQVVGLGDMPVINSLNWTFNGCVSLVEIIDLDTVSCQSMDNTFQGCTLLEVIDMKDSAEFTYMGATFAACPALRCITHIDTTVGGGGQSNMFQDSPNIVAPDAATQVEIASTTGGVWNEPCIVVSPLEILIERNDEAINLNITGTDLKYSIDGGTPASFTSGVDFEITGTGDVVITGADATILKFINGGGVFTFLALPPSLTSLTMAFENHPDVTMIHTNGLLTNILSMHRFAAGATNLGVIYGMYSAGAVTDWYAAFRDTDSSGVILEDWNFDSGTDFFETFARSNITNINSSSFLVATELESTFSNCNGLTYVNNMNIPLVTSLSSTFSGCVNLDAVDGNFLSVDTMEFTFKGCTNMTRVDGLNIGHVRYLWQTFMDCTSLVSFDASWDWSNAETLVGVFHQCSSLKCISQFNTLNNTQPNDGAIGEDLTSLLSPNQNGLDLIASDEGFNWLLPCEAFEKTRLVRNDRFKKSTCVDIYHSPKFEGYTTDVSQHPTSNRVVILRATGYDWESIDEILEGDIVKAQFGTGYVQYKTVGDLAIYFPESAFPTNDISLMLGSDYQAFQVFRQDVTVIKGLIVNEYSDELKVATYGAIDNIYNREHNTKLLLSPIKELDKGEYEALLVSRGYVIKAENEFDYPIFKEDPYIHGDYVVPPSGATIDPIYRGASMEKRKTSVRNKATRAEFEFRLF